MSRTLSQADTIPVAMPTEFLNQKNATPVKIVESRAVDPWATLYENLRRTDESQCESWKDEVDNLLILAGLFSAVVTAFVIETYRTLSPDPNEAIINLLSIIASREGSTNLNNSISVSTSGGLTRTQFSPTTTSVRVNIYFFLSLVLSLGTALIGIISLQWLRQHRSYPEQLSPEQRVALLNMRITALRRWKVHIIFTSLPVLLQAALVIFFIGLVEFVWHIDHKVIIPVGVLIAVILLFLILTTILPTLQLFFLHHAKCFVHQRIPVECPYKSPQAAAFRLLITSFESIFALSSGLFLPLYYILVPFYHFCVTPVYLYQSVQDAITRWEEFWSYSYRQPTLWKFFRSEIAHYQQKWNTLKTDFKRVIYLRAPDIPNFGSDYLCNTEGKDNWDSFDVKWIAIRDKYFRYRCNDESWLYQKKDDQANQQTSHYYDALHGLRRLILELNFSIEDDYLRDAVFHCIQAPPWVPHGDSKQLALVDQASVSSVFKSRNQYFCKIMQLGTDQLTTSLSDILSDSEGERLTEQMLIDESTCIFLKLVKSTLAKNAQTGGGASRELSKKFAEAQVRLLMSLYGGHFVLKTTDGLDDAYKALLVIQPEDLYSTREVDQTDEFFTHDWATAIHSFFRIIADESNSNTNAFTAHPTFQSFLSCFCKEVWIWCHQPKRGKAYESTMRKFIDGLTFIKSSLQPAFEPDELKSHRLFLCASFYVYRISTQKLESSELMSAAEEVYKRLKLYKERLGKNVPEIEEKQTYERYKIIGNMAWDLNADSFYPLFTGAWWQGWDELTFSCEINSPGLVFSVPEGPKDPEKQNTGNTNEGQANKNFVEGPTQNEEPPRSPTQFLNSFNFMSNKGNTKRQRSDIEGMNPDALGIVSV